MEQHESIIAGKELEKRSHKPSGAVLIGLAVALIAILIMAAVSLEVDYRRESLQRKEAEAKVKELQDSIEVYRGVEVESIPVSFCSDQIKSFTKAAYEIGYADAKGKR